MSDHHWRDVGRDFERRFEPPPERWWEPSIPDPDTFIIPTRRGGFRPGVDLDPDRRWGVQGASLAYRHSLGRQPRPRTHRPEPSRNPFPARREAPRVTLRDLRPRPRSLTERLTIRPDATPGIRRRGTPAHRPQDWMSRVRVPIASPKTFRDHALNLQPVLRAAAQEYVRRQSGFGFGTRPPRPVVIRRR